MKLQQLGTNDKLKKSRTMRMIVTEAQFKKLASNLLIEHRLGRLQKIKLVKVNN